MITPRPHCFWLRLRHWVVACSLLFSTMLAASAEAQNLRVTLLGTGTPRPMLERFSASILIEAGGQTLLFDCGRGATIRLNQMNVPLMDVNRLFLTHLHSDHIVGIPDLWLTGWIFGRTSPLKVWGPAGTKAMMSHLQKAYRFDVHMRRDMDEKLPSQGVVVEAKDIKEGPVYSEQGLVVTAFRVDHGPVKPAFGYRIDYAGHAVVLSGDTRPSEELIRHSKGADLIVHEVYAVDPELLRTSPLERTILQHHSSPEEAGGIFARTRPKLAVYSHIGRGNVSRDELITRTRKTYSGPLEVGEDLMVIEVGDEVRVRNLPH